MTEARDYRQLLLNLIGGICLDYPKPADSIFNTLDLMGIERPEQIDHLDKLSFWLGKEHGAKSTYDTDIYDPEYDDCKVCGRLKVICDGDYDDDTFEVVCDGARRREEGEDDD